MNGLSIAEQVINVIDSFSSRELIFMMAYTIDMPLKDERFRRLLLRHMGLALAKTMLAADYIEKGDDPT